MGWLSRLAGLGLTDKSMVSVYCRGQQLWFDFGVTLGALRTAKNSANRNMDPIELTDFIGRSLDREKDTFTPEERAKLRGAIVLFISLFDFYNDFLTHSHDTIVLTAFKLARPSNLDWAEEVSGIRSLGKYWPNVAGYCYGSWFRENPEQRFFEMMRNAVRNHDEYGYHENSIYQQLRRAAAVAQN